MKKKAIIISISSFKLLKNEIKLLKEEKPWGIILFKRNIKSIPKLKMLINKIRKLTKDSKFPIMIDEEGGAVSRLNKLIAHNLTQKYFGDIYKTQPKISSSIYKVYINNLCKIFREIGININTVPVLDVLRKKTDKIIGSRSFSNKPDIVKNLGNICVKQYSINKIATVIKHIPGHGCASTDSHLKLPKVKLSLKNLSSLANVQDLK